MVPAWADHLMEDLLVGKEADHHREVLAVSKVALGVKVLHKVVS